MPTHGSMSSAPCPTSEQRKTTRSADDLSVVILQPTSDFVILIDNSGGEVNLELDPPDTCEPSIYHLKLIVVAPNDVIVTPTSGLIEGDVSASFSEHVGINFKSSMDIFFDGTNWHIV